MELYQIENLLSAIQGCTFASLSAVTHPVPGMTKVTTGENVILFTNESGSGYERMVKRRLQEAGLDPRSFTVSDLPFGQRIPGTPLIVHKGKYYLQTVLIRPGEIEYTVGTLNPTPISVDVARAMLGGRFNSQGLPEGRRVFVSTYALDNVTEIKLLGEIVRAEMQGKR